MDTPLFGHDFNGGICSTVEWMNGVVSTVVLFSVEVIADVAVRDGGGGNDEDTMGGGGNGIAVDFGMVAGLPTPPLVTPVPTP